MRKVQHPVVGFCCCETGFLSPILDLRLRDATGTELGCWLSKIVSWYTKGGFDAKHRSAYHYAWRHFEVFNEPHHKMEHWPCAKNCGKKRGGCLGT